MRGLFYVYGVCFALAMILMLILGVERIYLDGSILNIDFSGLMALGLTLMTSITGGIYLLNTFQLLGQDRKIDVDRFDEVFDDRIPKLVVNDALKTIGIIAIVGYGLLLVLGISWILGRSDHFLFSFFRYFNYLLMVGFVAYFFQTYDRIIYEEA